MLQPLMPLPALNLEPVLAFDVGGLGFDGGKLFGVSGFNY